MTRSLLIALVLAASVSAMAQVHPPDPFPEPYRQQKRHMILNGPYNIYAANVIIDGVTMAPEYVTDDRGPAFWAADSNICSVSIAYEATRLIAVFVQGDSWPLANFDGITYTYSPLDSRVITGFTVERDADRTALSIRPNRVEWVYASSEFNPFAGGPGGMFRPAGEPLGAKLNGIYNLGGFR